MLFVVTLRNGTDVRDYPIDAVDLNDAIVKVRQVVPCPADCRPKAVKQIGAVTWDESAAMLEAVGVWWDDWCNHADGNEYCSEMDFDGAADLMACAYDAVYAINPTD
jgi:hypothetical protein